MDDVTASYPGLAPPTPGGRRSRSSSRMRCPPEGPQGGGRGAPNHAYVGDQPQPSSEPQAPPPAEGSQTEANSAGSKDLNFGWFSVPKPGVTQGPPSTRGAGEGQARSGSAASRDAPSRSASAAARDAPSRTGSAAAHDAPSRVGSAAARDAPSRVGSAAARDASSRVGSAAARDQPSRAGSAAARDQPSRAGSSAPCDGTDAFQQPVGSFLQGQGYDEAPPGGEDDVIIDWPMSVNAAQIYGAPRGSSDARQKRPGTGRCPSRSVPPTPPPPIKWGGYTSDSARPTYSTTSGGTRCFFTGDHLNNRSSNNVSNSSSNLNNSNTVNMSNCNLSNVNNNSSCNLYNSSSLNTNNNSSSNPLSLSPLLGCENDDNICDVTHCHNGGFRDLRAGGDSGGKEKTRKTKKAKKPKNRTKAQGDDHTSNPVKPPCDSPSPGKPPSSSSPSKPPSSTSPVKPPSSPSPGKPPSKLAMIKSGIRQALTSLTRWPQVVLDLRSQANAFKFHKFQNEEPLVVESEHDR